MPEPLREKVHILMVDDQPGKLLTYEAILSELGENLIKASSAREALDILLRVEIAIVLMDVSMPEIGGFELAEMIHQHPRFHNIAIIFISAIHLSDSDRLAGFARGAVDYISVPVIPELLRCKVSVFAELYRRTRQLEKLNADLERLSGRIVAAQDNERRRIARELHDSLGQELCAAQMILDCTFGNEVDPAKRQAAVELKGIIDRVHQQVRTVSYLLHPPSLDMLGLYWALSTHLEGLAKRSGVEIMVQIEPEFPRLRQPTEITVFRVIQEAVTNALRHSGGKKMWVALELLGEQIIGTVRDEGQGISEEASSFHYASIGVGIGGMKQRIEELGGELIVQNANPGVLVRFTIPAAPAVASTQGMNPEEASS